jgi:hypothetical protein
VLVRLALLRWSMLAHVRTVIRAAGQGQPLIEVVGDSGFNACARR